MHKGWLVPVIVYMLFVLIGSVFFIVGNREQGEKSAETLNSKAKWEPKLPSGSELLIVSLDESSDKLAKYLAEGDLIRLCVQSQAKRERPQNGWCGPLLTVAATGDDLKNGSALALYVPEDQITQATPYIVADSKTLLYAGPGTNNPRLDPDNTSSVPETSKYPRQGSLKSKDETINNER